MKRSHDPKPRKMWANPADFGELSMHLTAARDPSHDRGNTDPVSVIPLNDTSEMISRATQAFMDYPWTPGARQADRMRAALVAIGVLPRATKGGRK